MKHKNLVADLGLLYAALIWGSTFYIVKNSLSSINPVILVGYRFIFAALILGCYLAIKKKNLFENYKQGFVLGFILWLLYVSQTIGLKFTTASNSGFITGLFIIFVPTISLIIFKKKLSFVKLISIGIACFGLWFLTGGLKQINLGDILTLISALTYALHILFADRFIKNKINPIILSFQQFFVVGLLSFITGILYKFSFTINSIKIFNIILFLTLFPTVSAFVIQLVAQKFTAPVRVALIFSLEPVFAAIFAWTLGGETFIINRAVGGLLIVIAIILSEKQ